ncbi:MAG: GntR family transcriptional regulator [Chloroflexi bacterium]|nr:GntR family transcriptional regulator [Chloroflexota bacterium]
MEETFLYKQIAESIRSEILQGQVKPGDRLPAVRQMTTRWNCTPGTVQRAYQELAHQGLVTSRPGQGTHVTGGFLRKEESLLRLATLANRTEAFLLEMISSGYPTVEIEQAFTLALDHWRVKETSPSPALSDTIIFNGSHDLLVSWMAAHFSEIFQDISFQPTFSGSLGGLIALANGSAHLAGSHLWDEETNTYNIPFVRKLLPGKQVALVTLAQRRLGLILPPGNPSGIRNLSDLVSPGIIFINRQSGSGTRVWLDMQLHSLGVNSNLITGYTNERSTHADIARLIAEGQANAGIGLEAAALAFGLDFLFLTLERYDLVIPETLMMQPPIQALVDWLQTPCARKVIASLRGYDAQPTGEITWVT